MALNPFYIEPRKSHRESLERLGTQLQQFGLAKRQDQERIAEEEKVANLRSEAARIFSEGTPDEIADFSIKNPEVGQLLQQQQTFRSQRTKQNYVNSLVRALNNPSQIPEIAKQRELYLRAQGLQDEDMAQTLGAEQAYQEDPDKFLETIEKELAIIDPAAHKQFKAALADQTQSDKFKVVGNRLVDISGDEPKVVIDSPETADNKTLLSMGLVKVGDNLLDISDPQNPKAIYEDKDVTLKDQLELQKLQVQIADIQDRIGQRQIERETTKEIKDQKTRNFVSGIDSVLQEVDKAVEIAKNNITATGIPGAATSRIPGTPSYNLRRRLQTVQANLGFDKLQQMRDSSPTGGALGQVSERELGFLQATLVALDPNMGDEELIAGLEKVRKHYEAWKKTVAGELPEETEEAQAPDNDPLGIR